MPFTSLPGIIQLARSPFSATSIAPRMAIFIFPPRIIAKLVSDPKYEVRSNSVMVCFPAFIRSGSILSSVGNGPIPSIPFSDCSVTSTPSGIKLETKVGIPIPKFTYQPSCNSLAARSAI